MRPGKSTGRDGRSEGNVHCRAAKAFLAAAGIAFEEVNVREDLEGREELIERTGQPAVPVIVVGETVVQGFDRPRLRRCWGFFDPR